MDAVDLLIAIEMGRDAAVSTGTARLRPFGAFVSSCGGCLAAGPSECRPALPLPLPLPCLPSQPPSVVRVRSWSQERPRKKS